MNLQPGFYAERGSLTSKAHAIRRPAAALRPRSIAIGALL
jgi:hypothetical protein